MSETGDFGEPIEPAGDVADVPTGHAAVDEVLESLDGLSERPVAEHVAVFEQAHEQLRRALSGQASGAGHGDAGA